MPFCDLEEDAILQTSTLPMGRASLKEGFGRALLSPEKEIMGISEPYFHRGCCRLAGEVLISADVCGAISGLLEGGRACDRWLRMGLLCSSVLPGALMHPGLVVRGGPFR